MACGGRCWPRCLAWHGWLPTLSPRRVHLPWAVAMADGAALECALGAYPVHPGSLWDSGKHPEDVNDLAGDVPANPDIWADGSRDEDLDALVDCGAWGHAEDLDLDDDVSRIFSMVPGFLQTVQRAEYWGVILALQALMPVHLGIHNENVCNNYAKNH